MIYGKVLSVEAQESSGKIVNLIEVDTERVSDFFLWLDAILLLPFEMLIATGLLIWTAGVAGFAGLGVFLVFLVCDLVIVFKVADLSDALLEFKDTRMDMAVTLLEEVKNWKMLGLEKILLKKLCSFRGLELKKRKRINWMISLSELSMWTAPSLAATAVLCTQVYALGQPLESEAVFPIIMTLFILQESISLVPHALCDIIQGWVSSKRIEEFLDEPDTTVNYPTSEDAALYLRQASFAYQAEGEPELKNLTLEIQKGDLVALVGPVGSGKSTLLDALLGEVKLVSGDYRRKGKVSYAAGLESWIKNGTLRENILLGRSYDPERYAAVIQACALETDLNNFPSRDLTEIGERGINLSGGQKARLALARAVYEDVDVYLFDDPLSAVDFKTCKHVFMHCIKGLLQGRTVIIATHALQYLSLFDQVIVMNEGKVMEQAAPNAITTDIATLSARDKAKDSSDEDEGEEDSEEDELVEDEESESGAVSAEIYKTYWKYFGGYGAVFFVCFLCFLAEVSFFTGSFIIEQWEGDDDHVTSAVELFGIFCGVAGVFAGIHYFFLTMFAIRASSKLHDSMAERIVKAPVNLFFDVTPVGRILNRMSEDVEEVDEDLVWSLSSVIMCVVMLTCTFTVCILFAPLVVLIIPFILAVAYKLQRLYLGLQREIRRMGQVVQSPIISHLKATLDGAKSIRCFNNQAECIQQNQRLLDTHVQIEVVEVGAEIWLSIGMDLLAGCVLVFVSGLLIIGRDSISPGVAGMCLVYLMPLAESINSAVQSFAELETAMVSVERIHNYTQVIQEAPDTTEADDAIPEWPRSPAIEFVDVSVKYRPNLPNALKSISFKVEPGEKIGVVGRTGSGKSTLTLVLTRILELEKGKVLIDGVDISKLGLVKLRSALSLIPQDPVLFKGSLRENLDASGSCTDAEIVRILTKIDFPYMSLTDSVSDETLSSGQRQLICVARAALRKTKILLLDEATSSVDTKSEALVARLLAEEFEESTVLTIAHRLSTVESCSRLLVLERGQVKAFGRTKKLLGRKDLASELQGMAVVK
eukprot:CAMPEP_0204899178 /NCGR_PEP_ID=MMETSP1397-20131031/1702_1 /ASSEMBLY_ACC=CAM_ASM_000891 /TAXON_ID=49980 /ORGANISM="Climacostomum Climacostomum virens, Strain Stock W-24" /LENGTH=1044 /DNA_ID=CAMNT_0052067101 /DNA_START=431 /DNA_END=3565 /DNA_ORIENTATION=-